MTGLQRLKVLYAAMIAPMPEKMIFDMSDWYRRIVKDGEDCGTACCAFGLACTLPELQAEGLSLRGTVVDTIYKFPSIFGAYGFNAAEEFFRLDRLTTGKIFDSVEYPARRLVTRKQVAARIAKVIAEKEQGVSVS